MTAVDTASAEVLALTGVGVRLGGRTVLRDVGFRVMAGEFTGLIGANGAGKTTLLRVVLGLQPTTSGQVRVGAGGSAPDRRSIGYVPQKVSVDPDIPLRAKDLVELGLDGHRYGMRLPSRVRRARVADALSAVDALRFADSRVGTLSGGELQRVLIAHALISQPSLLLLDEPLANLDLGSEQEIVRLLARVSREQGVAVLLSAHEMNPLLPVLDRVVYLAHGRAVHGGVDDVIRSDVLTTLYGHQVDVLRVRGRILVVAGERDDQVTESDQPVVARR